MNSINNKLEELVKISNKSNNLTMNKKEYEDKERYVLDYIRFFDEFILRVPNKDKITLEEFFIFKNTRIDEIDRKKVREKLLKSNVIEIFNELVKKRIISVTEKDTTKYPKKEIIIPIIPPLIRNIPLNRGIVGICLKGMVNPSGSFNRCWFNTFIQSIFSIPEIRNVLLNLDLNIIPTSNIYKLSDTDIEKYQKELYENSKFISYYDANNIEIAELSSYYSKVIEMKKNIETLKVIKRVLQLLADQSNNNAIDIHTILFSATESYLEYLYRVLAPGSRVGETFDALEIFRKFISIFDHEIPELLGLYEIFTLKQNKTLECTKDGKKSTNTSITTIIELKKSTDPNPTIEESLKELQTKLTRSIDNDIVYNDNHWDKCINKHEGYDYNEVMNFELNDNTRYIFISLANFGLDENGDQAQVQNTIIDSSITINGIKFNLFGVIVYPGQGHYVYHLFKGDGTRELVKEYDDSQVRDTTTRNIDNEARFVIYVKA